MKLRFLLDIMFGDYQKKSLPLFLERIKGSDNLLKIQRYHEKETHNSFSISDVPSYVSAEIGDSLKSYKKFSGVLYPGFLIDLNPYTDKDDYLNKHFSSRTRGRFRARQRILDQCFNPMKKMYYREEILGREYDQLFLHFQRMLEERFDHKQAHNYEIPLIPLYKEMFRDLVKNGEGCIYAIFNEGIPICMSMSFIYDKTVYLFNTAFDEDYDIFGLGHQMVIEQLDWCFKNGFQTLDMGRGDFIHKRKWVNERYTYQSMAIVKRGKPLLWFKSLLRTTSHTLRYHILQTLKKIGIHHLARGFLKWNYRRKTKSTRSNSQVQSRIGFLPLDELPAGYKKVLLSSSSFKNLQKEIYRFCFKKKLNKPISFYVRTSEENVLYMKSGERKFKLMYNQIP